MKQNDHTGNHVINNILKIKTLLLCALVYIQMKIASAND